MKYLKDSNFISNLKHKKNLSLRKKAPFDNIKQLEYDNKSKINLILKDNSNITSLNASEEKKIRKIQIIQLN